MEANEKQQFIDRWEKQRKRGKLQYILRMAVIYTLMLLGVSLIVELIDGNATEFLNRQILSWRLALYAGFGLLIGWFMWWIMERQYRKIKSSS